MRITPNKSIMTSYIKSPYLRHVTISALLKLIICHRLQFQSTRCYWSSPGAGPYVCIESRACAYGHLQWLCTCAGEALLYGLSTEMPDCSRKSPLSCIDIYIFLWGNLSRAIIYFSNSIKERFTNSTREFCNSLFADVRVGLTIRNKLVYV